MLNPNNYVPYEGNCLESDKKQNNCTVEGPASRIDVYTEQGNVNINEGVKYISDELNQGHSVIVGLSTGEIGRNHNKYTGHFVNVVSVSLEYKDGHFENGFHYFDNAIRSTGTNLEVNKLVYGWSNGNMVLYNPLRDRNHILTEIRRNRTSK